MPEDKQENTGEKTAVSGKKGKSRETGASEDRIVYFKITDEIRGNLDKVTQMLGEEMGFPINRNQALAILLRDALKKREAECAG